MTNRIFGYARVSTKEQNEARQIESLTAAGVDPVYLGILLVMNGAIGLITPPVGTVLNVGVSISKLSVFQVAKGIMPFLIVYMIILLLFMIFPSIILKPLEWFM